MRRKKPHPKRAVNARTVLKGEKEEPLTTKTQKKRRKQTTNKQKKSAKKTDETTQHLTHNIRERKKRHTSY